MASPSGGQRETRTPGVSGVTGLQPATLAARYTCPYLFVGGGPSGDRTRGATIKSRVPYHSATGPYFWRFLPDSNRELRVLQTAVLPFD